MEERGFESISHRELKDVTLKNAFDDRSDVAQEIISSKASFYEKWTLLIFLFLLLLITVGAWFVKYPDIIQGDALFISNNAPKAIIPKTTGKLIGLLVKNNQKVKQGEIIGWIESNSDKDDVLELARSLDSCVNLNGKSKSLVITKLIKKEFTNLGELQKSFQLFTTEWQQYNDYKINGFYSNRKSLLLKDIKSLQRINLEMSHQKTIIEENNSLAISSFEMSKKLFEEKVISAEEYRQAQSSLLNKQLSLQQIDVDITNQQTQIRDKQKEINQLNHDFLQQQQIFDQALQTLRSNVHEWLREYTIQAPTTGLVVYAHPVQQNQYLKQGESIGYIAPQNNKYYAEIRLSQNNFGKIDTGMKVQLRLNAYPYQEMGVIEGTLNYVSSVSIDSGFIGIVQLNKGLMTNHGKVVQYHAGLKAKALIITRDMRLLERLYYSIVKVTSINK